jgi:transposase
MKQSYSLLNSKKKEKTMSRVHYNDEMRLQTVKLVLKGEKSATKIAKDIGVNPNTICRWVQEYRKQNNLPTYEEERRIRKVSVGELAAKNKELERKLKQREKELADEKETVEILKKSTSRTSWTWQACLPMDMIEA